MNVADKTFVIQPSGIWIIAMLAVFMNGVVFFGGATARIAAVVFVVVVVRRLQQNTHAIVN